MPRRILYIQKATGGGSTRSLYEMVRGLDRRRYEPVLLFYHGAGHLEEFRALGFQIMMLSPSLRSDWALVHRIRALIRAERIDLVHHNNNPAAQRVSIFATWLARVPQVCHVRFFKSYSRLLDRSLARTVDFYLYVSAAIERDCREQLRIPSDRGAVVYNPCDLAAFEKARERGSVVRRELGVSEGEPLIANVGRLVWWKGQDVFLRALTQVIRTFPNAKALIVGAPNSRPAAQRYDRTLRELVSELGLSDHVIFTGFRRDIPEIMAASDIVLHSSSKPDPLPRVVMEAMAAGRPVVATAGGGVPEMVEHGATGWLVPPGDARQMARAMESLLRDPVAASRMGQRARERARERFASARFAEMIQEVYSRALVRYERVP